MKIVKLNRRDFLKSSALVTGGLLLGFEAPVTAAVTSSPAQLGPFLQMTNEGKIRLGVPVVEMGQGVYTSLAMCVVEELGLGLEDVENIETIHHPSFKNPVFSSFTNGSFSIQVTGGSCSMKGWAHEFQRIGATARDMLVNAASKQWNLPPNQLRIEKSTVYHPVSGTQIEFGQLATKASTLSPPLKISIKSPDQFNILGNPTKRWDTSVKINGKATYGADIKLPEMLYGTVRHVPILGGKIIRVDDSKAKQVPGFLAAIPLANQIIVVADSTWSAFESSKLIELSTEGGFKELDDSWIQNKLEKDSEQDGVIAGEQIGDFQVAFAKTQKKFESEYTASIQAHACMEPLTATAHVTEEKCEFWGSIQGQDVPVLVGMKVTGLPPEKIKVHTTYLGGGFGRKVEADYIIPPVVASKVMERPVQITWSREADTQGGFYRPPGLIKFKVGLDENNLPNSFHAKVITPSATLHFAEVLGYFPPWIQEDGYDWTMLEGMLQQPSLNPDGSTNNQYKIPNVKINYIPSEIPITWGFWRSIGAGPNVFALESLIDEIATIGKRDSLELRKMLMSHNSRALNVLDSVREFGNWGNPSEGNFQGLSHSDYLNSIQAQIAEISASPRGVIRVHKVTCVIDCGLMQNPHIVLQQLRGAIIFGLTSTLMGEINVKDGQIVQSNFDDYKMIRLKETPEINIHLIESKEKSGGIGEAGTPLIGPAVANAVFAATGKRVRRLPIRKEDLS